MPFDPLTASVPCIAWYDHSDNSTLTLSGTDISQVNDKSASGYNLVQATDSLKPITSIISRRQFARQNKTAGAELRKD